MPAVSEGRRQHHFLVTVFLPIILTTSLVTCFVVIFFTMDHFPNGIKYGVWEIATNFGFANLQSEVRLRDDAIRIPKRLSRLARNTNIPRIVFDIKFKHMQQLEAKRELALRTGILVANNGDYVPASIRVGDHTIRAKLRLKGDYIDHLKGKKWSMRVHIKDNDQVFGLRRFSIQHPKTRGFQAEILFHETLRQFDILTPKYFFVDVVINGENIGIMAVEEHFSKELLERNERKESVIIRFDEDVFWTAWTVWGTGDFSQPFPRQAVPFDSYLNTSIRAFRTSKILDSGTLTREYNVSVGLLRGFMAGSLEPSETFDAELLGSYLAVSEFWGALHEIRWNNLRFYLNPLTMKLEPVAFDADLAVRLPPGQTITSEPIARKMLKDLEIKAAFRRTLATLVEETESGRLIERLRQIQKPIIYDLQKEFFLLEPFDFDELKSRARSLSGRSQGDEDLRRAPIYAHAYIVKVGEKSYLEIQNALPTEVEIQAINWTNKSGDTFPFEPITQVEFPLALPVTKIGDMPESLLIDYQPLPDPGPYTLSIRSVIKGQKTYKDSSAIYTFAPLRHPPMPDSSVAEQQAQHPFLQLHEDKHSFIVKPGRWRVEGDIVIPHGFDLEMGAGTTLQFQEGGSLVVYGTTTFTGTAAAPIVLEGISGKDGKGGLWQGIAVYDAQRRSTWAHVAVRNTSGMDWPLWKLTGGTTFYKSDFDMTDCVFSGNTGEDALNIIHSTFTITDIAILDTASDGLDADFAIGSLSRGLLRNIGVNEGGDAIDVSGSEITIDGIHFIQINDKAISVGEGSNLIATDIIIENTGVGAASKDNSILEIHNSSIKNARIAALMSYTKKPEYGPATLVATNIEIQQSDRAAIAQNGNRLSIDGIQIQTQELDVDRMYNTIMKSEK